MSTIGCHKRSSGDCQQRLSHWHGRRTWCGPIHLAHCWFADGGPARRYKSGPLLACHKWSVLGTRHWAVYMWTTYGIPFVKQHYYWVLAHYWFYRISHTVLWPGTSICLGLVWILVPAMAIRNCHYMNRCIWVDRSLTSLGENLDTLWWKNTNLLCKSQKNCIWYQVATRWKVQLICMQVTFW